MASSDRSTRSAASTPTSTTATTTTPRSTDYSSIDIQPGYQKLCGAQALVVRALPPHRLGHRPQRPPAGLHPLGEGPVQRQDQLLNERGRAAEDLRQARADRPQSAHDRRADQPVRPGRSTAGKPRSSRSRSRRCSAVRAGVPTASSAAQQTPCYVGAASAQAEESAYHAFMTPTTAGRRHRASSTTAHAAGGGQGVARRRRAYPGPDRRPQRRAGQARRSGSSGSRSTTRSRSSSGSPVLLEPDRHCARVRDPPSPGSYPRAYLIHDRRGVAHYGLPDDAVINPVARRVLRRPGHDLAEPADPEQAVATTKFVNGKTAAVLRTAASSAWWRGARRGAAYWISNTLTENIPNRQMVAIAASLTRGGGK